MIQLNKKLRSQLNKTRKRRARRKRLHSRHQFHFETLEQRNLLATIVGGDFAGADLTPANGDTLQGMFTNVGTFHVPVGATVFVDSGVPLEVHAGLSEIFGTLDATGAGFAGGAAVPNVSVSPPDGTVTGMPGSGLGGGSGGKYGNQIHGSASGLLI